MMGINYYRVFLWQVICLSYLVSETSIFCSAFTPSSMLSRNGPKSSPSLDWDSPGAKYSSQRGLLLITRRVTNSRSTIDEGHSNEVTAEDQPNNENSTTSSSSTTTTRMITMDDDLDMPWSEIQDWALRDKLPKYTVPIRLVKGGKERMQFFGLWRTMINDVTEIAGYPVDFLQEIYSRNIQNGNDDSTVTQQQTPALLPFLDEYEFTPSGGMLGNVYGVPGLADGTKIETSPVDKVQETLPKGYIRTVDGLVAYELGRPVRDEFATSSDDDLQRTAGTLLKSVSNASSKVTPLMKAAGSNMEEDPDQMLVRLGASTGILLAGAVAVNMLSHHLTVNVFWV